MSSASPPVSDVVAGAAEQDIEAALAEQRVVTGAAEDLVIARSAGRDVIAVAAEQVRTRQCAAGLIELEHVVAVLAEQLDHAGVRDRGSRHDHAVGQDRSCGVAADRGVVGIGGAEQRNHAVRRAGRAVLQQDVLARAAVEHVLAGIADQHVVPGTAGELVGAGAADQDVVAVAAV